MTKTYHTPLEDWLRGEDVIDMLDISQRTLQYWRTKQIIPFLKLGNKIYYRRADVERMLDQQFEQQQGKEAYHE